MQRVVSSAISRVACFTLLFVVAVSLSNDCRPAVGQEFTVDRLFVIGDSLSDGGAYTQAIVAGSGGTLPAQPRYRFLTNNLDGSSLTWAEHLASDLGITSAPDVLQGVPLAGIPTVEIDRWDASQGYALKNIGG